MNHKVYAPNIHLFAFHLRNGYGDSTGEQSNNQLWRKCDQIFEKLKIEDLKLTQKLDQQKFSDSPRVDLLKETEIKDNKVSLPLNGQLLLNDHQVVKISGFAYPLQTHDSYALWLNLRRPDRENGKKTESVDLSILSKFNPDSCLLPEFIESSLGQTLLITAWLTEGQNYQDKQFLRELADQCVEEFIPDPLHRPKFNRDGLLFGSAIFEYGIINQPPPHQHILVWLFCHTVTDTKFEKCYKELMDLFYYRSKVVQSYLNSRKVYKNIYDAYKTIEDEVEKIECLGDKNDLYCEELFQYKGVLKKIPKAALEYSRLLRDLDQCRHMIKMNAQCYEEKLAKIQAKLQSDNLIFLEIFSRKNCLYLQEEIQADLGYFEHGSGLLEKLLSAIRGMVEIEQAEQAICRQDTIKWLGAGIGTAVVVASSSTHLTPENPIHPPFTSRTLHPFITSLLMSAFLGILVGLIARWLIQQRRHKEVVNK